MEESDQALSKRLKSSFNLKRFHHKNLLLFLTFPSLLFLTTDDKNIDAWIYGCSAYRGQEHVRIEKSASPFVFY